MKALIALCVCGLSMAASAQLNYSDTKYGVSFQYPAGYKLTEGTLGEEDPGLGMLGHIPMEFVAPGERLVTVEVPADAYPGTDLVNAFFTVSVNPHLTREECTKSSEDTDENSMPKKRLMKKISEIEFQGVEDYDAASMHQYSGVYYHGFSKGYCYELGYGMATAGYGAVDDLKQVDSGKVYSILEKILGTVKVRPPAKAVATNSPSIQALTLTPLDSDPNRYRISWDVAGAASEQIWLSVSCSDEVTILKVADTNTTTEKSEFPCDVPGPARSVKGALDLEFRNLSGEHADETVRLFVEGERSVSKELPLSLPPLPAIFGVASVDGKDHLSHGKQESPVLIDIGRTITIDGAGFVGSETVWIGPTKIPIDRFDIVHITFIVPISLPTGEDTLLVKNEHGVSNPVRVLVERTQLLIFDDKGSPMLLSGRSGVVPGRVVHMQTKGFFPVNTVWIGSTSTIGRVADGHAFGGRAPRGQITSIIFVGPGGVTCPFMDFTVPASLAPGTYPIYFTNELGKSNVLTLTVLAAR